MHKILFASLLLILTACAHDKAPLPIDFHAQLPADMVGLRKISPAEYPSFAISAADAQRLVPAIDNSLKYLAAPSSNDYYPYLDITHGRAHATLRHLRELVVNATTDPAYTPAGFDARIRQDFDVYKSFGAPDPNVAGKFTDVVLFTGYCTPIYDGSLQRSEVYKYPLYKLPADLVRDNNTGQVFGRRTPDGQIVPYYTRGEIEQSGALAGHELVWLKSRWETYVVTIQGSAEIRLAETGKLYEIGFAGTNGYDYTVSIADQMVADGVITPQQHNGKDLKIYFAQHPEMLDKYLPLNKRYVFFTERPGGPFGSLNVPVTPMASIATDKSKHDIYPRAMPAFLQVPIPAGNDPEQVVPFKGFMLDQDTGGAIRAAGRCDIYMGIGAEAEAVAGHELQQGSLYYIAIKPELMLQPVPPVPKN